ncbi:hypothetical protein J6590_013729 [Homalodisca vitripennis]|nr:hypothetical protein J6590_013729 [Homalodisca vitripennis]
MSATPLLPAPHNTHSYGLTSAATIAMSGRGRVWSARARIHKSAVSKLMKKTAGTGFSKR